MFTYPEFHLFSFFHFLRSLTYDVLTWPCQIYQTNISPTPLTQFFPLGLSAVSSNLLPFAPSLPTLGPSTACLPNMEHFSSLVATTTCDTFFSFRTWSVFKYLQSHAAKALSSYVIMCTTVEPRLFFSPGTYGKLIIWRRWKLDNLYIRWIHFGVLPYFFFVTPSLLSHVIQIHPLGPTVALLCNQFTWQIDSTTTISPS